jgi:hypothetical protein
MPGANPACAPFPPPIRSAAPLLPCCSALPCPAASCPARLRALPCPERSKFGRKKKERENQAQQTASDLAEADREEFDAELHLQVRALAAPLCPAARLLRCALLGSALAALLGSALVPVLLCPCCCHLVALLAQHGPYWLMALSALLGRQRTGRSLVPVLQRALAARLCRRTAPPWGGAVSDSASMAIEPCSHSLSPPLPSRSALDLCGLSLPWWSARPCRQRVRPCSAGVELCLAVRPRRRVPREHQPLRLHHLAHRPLGH